MEMPNENIPSIERKRYIPPVLECYGNISNFTTGGSGKKSEYSLVKKGMGMSATEECVMNSSSRMRNTVMKCTENVGHKILCW